MQYCIKNRHKPVLEVGAWAQEYLVSERCLIT